MRGGVATAVTIAVAAAVAASHGAAASPRPFWGVAFDDRAGDRLVLTTGAYRLALGKRSGAVVELTDRATGTRLLRGTGPCLWSVVTSGRHAGCTGRFSYRWAPAAATLTLSYRGAYGTAAVTVRARPAYLDLQLRLDNRAALRTAVSFPDGLVGDVDKVEAGYAPNALPGVKLGPGFFSRVGGDVEIYPSRWAFADYLALDAGGAHLALYSVVPGPIRPVSLGFAHLDAGRCSGTAYCVVHEFQTWIHRSTTWASPVVRLRVGQTAQQSILAYRHDNGIDAYPSLAAKLGPRLATLAQAPLVKANLPLIKPFRDWAPDLARLPSPLLLHPVAYQTGGHDKNVPDTLPPDPRFGTDADFRSMIAAAHADGDLVMPYENVSWWDPDSPTMKSVREQDVAVLDERGAPSTVAYNDRNGVIVSASSPVVKQRVAQQLDAWRTEIPVDCLFLDQLGARPWLRDFNAASPRPESYDDAWLALLRPYADRCLMVEDGWDRLARDFVGFHGGLLMMSRELGLPDQYFGEGNWEPYPLAVWLFHDKVLLYQHDLYDGTLATDGEVLTWNLAFGMVSSVDWAPGSPWLELASRLQRTLGPHYVGVPLADYRSLAAGVTESTFGDLRVVANRGPGAYAVDGFEVSPNGFLARTGDAAVVAGAFTGTLDGVALSPGTHYVLFERSAAGVTVRQPVGDDTDLAVTPPAGGGSIRVTALGPDGAPLQPVASELRGGRVVFRYARVVDGRTVAAYRVTTG